MGGRYTVVKSGEHGEPQEPMLRSPKLLLDLKLLLDPISILQITI